MQQAGRRDLICTKVAVIPCVYLDRAFTASHTGDDAFPREPGLAMTHESVMRTRSRSERLFGIFMGRHSKAAPLDGLDQLNTVPFHDRLGRLLPYDRSNLTGLYLYDDSEKAVSEIVRYACS